MGEKVSGFMISKRFGNAQCGPQLSWVTGVIKCVRDSSMRDLGITQGDLAAITLVLALCMLIAAGIVGLIWTM